MGGPQVLQEAEHDVGCAAARAVPGLPGRDPCWIVAQQLMQGPVRLPAVHSAVKNESAAVSAFFSCSYSLVPKYCLPCCRPAPCLCKTWAHEEQDEKVFAREHHSMLCGDKSHVIEQYQPHARMPVKAVEAQQAGARR